MTQDKYYYFPTMTNNIMFVREKKYICLSDRFSGMIQGETYIVHDFINENVLENIIFRDSLGSLYRVSPFNCGSFVSLSKQRKSKLQKINEKAEDNKIKNSNV